MIWVICLITALTCFFEAIWTLDIDRVHQTRLLKGREDPVEGQFRRLNKRAVRFTAVGLALCGGLAMWQIMSRTSDWLNICKLVVALLCLLGSACVDFLEHRIPNFFSATMALGGILLLTLGLFTGQDGALSYISTGVVCAAASALALAVASLLSQKGIGAGDIKLIAALGLIGGVYVLCGTLVLGMALCAIVGCVLLLTKKKTLHEGVPFGPFLFMGYLATLFVIDF